ncbi:MarR family winged helix-turn-helix transcriptional regulator [Amycolatopsis regifaucium]|uniref:MarR family transcriptional regulator n=1 Tax=Amycolatopsis regifaucium TaxID=546365 RepID=A0A154M742_9PSEU|nr:MarR family winged helix-turn-helix transcriptional regulator [Amycolatopsis regifaucium]KZB80435.1 MarR family transcriptional regulator [Amycolatopsis regifaucium]OKA05405.1 MarR family transcriptional regulator [Amycolatopsis regifaucium]SFJ09604.1 DNA-binding transcriptional regulator, MarR family [Amycolatopsis regifaucium]
MVNVVDEKVNQVVDRSKRVSDSPGFELPLLLFAGFRSIIDRLHAELAEQGHPDVRPAYGFAMQAVGRDGATASEIGRRLGVSKQAAGKTVDKLEQLGYVERADDPADARRKIVRLTARGFDSLGRSAAIFDELRKEWVAVLGADRVRALEGDLRAMAPSDGFRLDVASWFGA